jgi:hypothetical protein
MNLQDHPRSHTMNATTSHERSLDHLALRRARAKMGWGLHAAVFLAVNTGLIGLSLATGRHWAIYPLLGWGLGLAIHGLAVWLLAPGGSVMDRLVARERAALQARDRW